MDPLTVARTFGLVALAELGDKSQLVCLALATRHRPVPVVVGATLAFALLNALAAGVGAAVGLALPSRLVAVAAAALFVAFGVRALRAADEPEEDAPETLGRGPLVAAFVAILGAELGDKTQLEVLGLAATSDPVDTWVGATLALAATSALGAYAGHLVGARLSGPVVRRVSGVLFLAFAVWLLVDTFLI